MNACVVKNFSSVVKDTMALKLNQKFKETDIWKLLDFPCLSVLVSLEVF